MKPYLSPATPRDGGPRSWRYFRCRWITAAVLLLGGATASAQIRVDDSVLHTSPINAAGVAAERNRIINFIWGGAGFPSAKLPSMHRSVSSPIANLVNVQSVEVLRITMDDGEYTLGYHFVPANGRRNRLVIVHEGHACYLDDGPDSGNPDGGIQRTVRALIANGYGVLALSMPRMSPANAEIGDPGNCSAGDHASMFNLPLTGGNALKFFLEPVIASINYLSAQYADFNMVGLSGGGWTTTIVPAVDTRIKLSFPVAGSVPLYLRNEPYNHDLEQYLGAFYGASTSGTAGIAGYVDLYLLASRGPGRHQIQILNRHDNCCFGETQHNAAALGIAFEPALRVYETRLKIMTTDLGGSFRTFIDEVSPSHMISDNAINNVILPVLADASGAFTIPTTIRSNWTNSYCVDVPNVGRLPQDHDYVQIFACNGGANQEWSFRSDGTIRNQWGNGLCLDVPDFGRPPQNGDKLQVFQCHGGINQKFDLLSDGSFRSRWNGLCVDVPDFGRAPQNGDRLQVYSCHGSANQSFSANKLTTAMSSVWSPGLCLDVPVLGRPPQSGDRMQVFQCHGGANQRFNMQSDATIRTEFGALCLNVPDLGRPPQNGDPLVVAPCNGSINQQFLAGADGSIRSCTTGNLCVDIPDFGRPPRNNDALQLYQCHGSPNQSFTIRQ
jgi:hypothetical protein